MSARILRLAAALITLTTAAAAQTPSAKDQPAPGMELGRAVQPVMDREILAHLFFNELEGRFNGSNTEFRWEGEGGSAPITINWIKSEGMLQGSGTLDDGQPQFLDSRAITTYFDLQGGLRSDIDSRPTRNWGAWAFRVSRLTFLMSSSPTM